MSDQLVPSTWAEYVASDEYRDLLQESEMERCVAAFHAGAIAAHVGATPGLPVPEPIDTTEKKMENNFRRGILFAIEGSLSTFDGN